jgi:SAM-dependent methyltransferase
MLRTVWRSILGFERRQQIARFFSGNPDMKWSRVVMIEAMSKLVEDLQPQRLRALEISGNNWQHTGFMSYSEAHFPDYDLCERPLPDRYDIVIADQVFEHLLWPYRAGKNVYEMLAPGGYFLVSTPFLVRVHNFPTDCTRWTEMGMKYFLAECGFPLGKIRTDSWGNRRCAIADFKRWTPYRTGFHTLTNEPDFPVHVWALAQKDSAYTKGSSSGKI